MIENKYYLNFGTVGNFLYPDTAMFGIVDIENGKVTYKPMKARYDDSVVRRRTEEIRSILYGEGENRS